MKMKAIVIDKPGGLDALVERDVERPVPGPRDVLVEIEAISVNPVDVKTRTRDVAGDFRILGWDAAGTVVATGSAVRTLKTGDAVWYAGAYERPGSYARFEAVDERLVAKKPATLDWAEAAALPLTATTAWEALFDRLDVERAVPGAANAIVIVGGSGGVGSIAIQLARATTALTVIATASRPETTAWAREMGAHHVIDHSKPLAAQIEALGIGAPGFVFSTTHTDAHIAEIGALLAPQGRLCLIDDPKTLDITGLKRKAISVHWEFMFVRSMFQTPDMAEHARMLGEIARLVDEGKIRTTMTDRFSPIDAENLRRAHAIIESEKSRGKIVLAGWPR